MRYLKWGAVPVLVCAIGSVALASEVVQTAPATGSVTIAWGDMVTALVTAAGGPTVILTVVVGLAMRLFARVNAPLAAAAEAAGVDRLVINAGAHALATTEGAVAGKTLTIDKVPDVLARMTNFGMTYGPGIVAKLGGVEAFRAHLVAWLSKEGYLPPETSTATLAQ